MVDKMVTMESKNITLLGSILYTCNIILPTI